MAVKAAYELPYTGEEVQEMLEQTATNKNLIDGLAASLDDKVDKVAGKDLSTNDYTNEEKAKLSSLENGAQKNVQADWNAISGDAFIKNKPTIPQGVTVDDALNGTSENPVQNKVINNALNGKQSTIADLNDIRSGANAGATAYQKPSGGIPKSDLSSAVQTSLGLADTALQSYTETDPVFSASPAAGITSSDITNWNGKYTKSNSGIPKADLANDVQTSLGKADTALQSYTESDPTVPSHVKAITTTDISNWNSKQPALTFDSTPTASSNNPVTSAGIKAYVDNATPDITMDNTPTSGSSNPVKSSGIYNALQGKQNTLTFDSTPTASSSNPVTSGGVKAALDLKANQSTTYTKTEVDGLLEDVAILADDDGQATTLDFDPQADTVWNKAQTLGSAQQAQARNNIGAIGSVTVNGTTYTPTNGNVDLGTISGGGGSTGHRVMIVTQAYYNSLSNYDADTVYIISDSIETAPEVTIMTSAEYADATKSNTTIYFVK